MYKKSLLQWLAWDMCILLFNLLFVALKNGEGNGNLLQCSCLENPRAGGASWAAIYGVAQSQTRLKWLSSSSSSLQKALLCKVINISIYYNNNIKMLEIWSGEEGNRYFHSAFHSPDTLHCFSHLVKLHYFIRKATYSYILWLPW